MLSKVLAQIGSDDCKLIIEFLYNIQGVPVQLKVIMLIHSWECVGGICQIVGVICFVIIEFVTQ